MTPRPHRNPQDDTRNTLLADLEAERRALQARIDALDRAMQALAALDSTNEPRPTSLIPLLRVAEERPRYGAPEPPKQRPRAAAKFRYTISPMLTPPAIDTLPGTPQKRAVLTAIAEAGPDGATVKDILTRTGISSSSLGWILRMIRDEGLVTVTADR